MYNISVQNTPESQGFTLLGTIEPKKSKLPEGLAKLIDSVTQAISAWVATNILHKPGPTNESKLAQTSVQVYHNGLYKWVEGVNGLRLHARPDWESLDNVLNYQPGNRLYTYKLFDGREEVSFQTTETISLERFKAFLDIPEKGTSNIPTITIQSDVPTALKLSALL